MDYMRSFPAHVAAKFCKNEPAHAVLRNQESMAFFTHMVLNDLAKYRTGLEGYTKMPEAERVEKFFGVYNTAKRETEQKQLRDELKRYQKAEERKQLELLVLYTKIFDKYAKIFVEHVDAWYREAFLLHVTKEVMNQKPTDPTYFIISELYRVSKKEIQLEPLPESVNTYFLKLLTEFNLLAEEESYTPEEVTEELLGFLWQYEGDFADAKMHTEFLQYVKSLKIGCFKKVEECVTTI